MIKSLITYSDYNSLKNINPLNHEIAYPIKKVFQATLPLISLQPSARLPITVIFGISHTIASISSLKEAWNKQELTIISQALLETAISTASVACTIFKPSLGVLISTGQELLTHSSQLVEFLKNKEYKKALFAAAELTNNSLYISLFFTGASQIVIVSLSLQILLGLLQSHRNFQNEKYLEGFSNLLISLIKGHQLKIEINVFRLQIAINQHLDEVENQTDPLKANEEDKIFLNEKEILEKAKEYFKNPEILKKQAPNLNLSQILNASASDKEIIDALLKDYQGFCLGENHSHESAKGFLINNMEYLKSKNVKILFSEGWNISTQKIIDKYFSVQHLRELESSDLLEVQKLLHHANNHLITKPGSSYTPLALIEKAKRNGIRVVGIDYEHANYGNNSYKERLMKMNFVASRTIEANRKAMKSSEKFVVFAGAAHLRRFNDQLSIQGIADLTETPAIWIQDKNPELPKNFPSLWYSKLDIRAPLSSVVNVLLKESAA